jgi:putative methyltransferase (TIGR04325 family)
MSTTGQIYFSGDYPDWAQAANDATGYDQHEILEKVVSATLAVISGEAVAQRDGIILDEIPYNFPLIATLLSAALEDGNRLEVLDFGGALGSGYFDSRAFLQAVSSLNWSTIEQPHFVKAGRLHVASAQLHFFETIHDCVQNHRPNVVILSGVLQCLPDPWRTLQDLLQLGSRCVFIDRTAVIQSGSDRLTIQHVPQYPAIIPAWFLSETKLLAEISGSGYQVLCEFPALDRYSLPGAEVAFKGFICKRA